MTTASLRAEQIARLLRAALADELPRALTVLHWIALADYGYPDKAAMTEHLWTLDRMGSRRVSFTVPWGLHARPARPARPEPEP